MKQVIFSFVLFCMGALACHAEDTDISTLENTIYIENTTAMPGTQLVLSVKMKNTISVQGFQFDLVLPEGVTVAEDEDGFLLAELSTERTTAKKTDYFNSELQQVDEGLRLQRHRRRGGPDHGEHWQGHGIWQLPARAEDRQTERHQCAEGGGGSCGIDTDHRRKQLSAWRRERRRQGDDCRRDRTCEHHSGKRMMSSCFRTLLLVRPAIIEFTRGC